MASGSLQLFRTLAKSSSTLKPLFSNPSWLSTPEFSIPGTSITQRRSYADIVDDPSAISGDKSPESNSGRNSGFSSSVSSSLKELELEKFAKVAETWWDLDGPFKPLHSMNPTRVSFIRSTLCRHFRKDPYCARPFEGLNIIDVGCGGGILSEPLARMGATVTGIDAVEKNIKIARLHAGLDPLTSSIKYCCTTAGFFLNPRFQYEEGFVYSDNIRSGVTKVIERLAPNVTFAIEATREIAQFRGKIGRFGDLTAQTAVGIMNPEQLVEKQQKFDVVIALEVIEHVAYPYEFCKSLSALTVSNGAVVISTINRSMRAYAAAIVAAEYILQWLPKGTHQWSSFLTPEELVLILQRSSISVQEMAGFVYNPLTGKWALSDDTRVNFIAYGAKQNQ